MLRYWRLKPSPALRKALRNSMEGFEVIVIVSGKEYSATWEKLEFKRV